MCVIRRGGVPKWKVGRGVGGLAFIQRNYVAFIQYHQTGIYTTTHWHLYIESGWGIYANRKLRGGPDPKSDKK